jgi:hypothetical protein
VYAARANSGSVLSCSRTCLYQGPWHRKIVPATGCFFTHIFPFIVFSFSCADLTNTPRSRDGKWRPEACVVVLLTNVDKIKKFEGWRITTATHGWQRPNEHTEARGNGFPGLFYFPSPIFHPLLMLRLFSAVDDGGYSVWVFFFLDGVGST